MRKIFIFLFILLSLKVSAKESNPFLPDCKMLGSTVISFTHCNARIVIDDDYIIESEYVNGLSEGISTVKSSSEGLVYRGSAKEGELAGYGKMVYSDGYSLIGDYIIEFKRGISYRPDDITAISPKHLADSSEGVYLRNNTFVYVGGLREGKFNGEGIIYFIKDDNKKYKKNNYVIGKFDDGKLIVNYAKDIDKCEIDSNNKIINEFCYLRLNFKDEGIQIDGVYEYDELKLGMQLFTDEATAGLVVGYFKNDELHGYGFTSEDIENTEYYIGEYKDGKRDGYGVNVTAKSTHFGEYKNGLKDGFGFNKGQTHEILGMWRNGIGNGYAEIIDYQEQKITRGNYIDDKLNGLGYVISSSQTYIGEFKDDKADGHGLFIKGEEFQTGLFSNDKFIEEQVYCKKTFGNYYAISSNETCNGFDSSVEFSEFILDKNGGLGDRWLEEYYKKERINLSN